MDRGRGAQGVPAAVHFPHELSQVLELLQCRSFHPPVIVGPTIVILTPAN